MIEEKVITVYGTGCKKCEQLHANALEAAEILKVPTRVDYVKDIIEISAKGIMSTPALAIDDQIVSMGKVLDTETIGKLLNASKPNAGDASSNTCSCGGNCQS